jgi:outer membrane protein
MEVSVKENEAGYVQSKAAQFPTLNAGIGEAYTYQKNTQGTGSGDNSSLSGSYSLRSEVTLYNGFRLKNTLAQQALNVQSASLGVDETKNNIELAVTEAYLQVLYARESVTNAQNTLTASEAQVNRSRTLYEAGYIAESNFAQVEAQYSNDSYSLVMAQNNLNQQMLSLKQLLELGINQDLNLYFPELKDEDVVRQSPTKQQVFNTAVSFMPEIQNSRLSMESASLGIESLKAGFYAKPQPERHQLLPGQAAWEAMDLPHNWATISTRIRGDSFIPIFNNKQAKTSLSKAKLNLQTAKLTYAETGKRPGEPDRIGLSRGCLCPEPVPFGKRSASVNTQEATPSWKTSTTSE